jgi:hypothetical protein
MNGIRKSVQGGRLVNSGQMVNRCRGAFEREQAFFGIQGDNSWRQLLIQFKIAGREDFE